MPHEVAREGSAPRPSQRRAGVKRSVLFVCVRNSARRFAVCAAAVLGASSSAPVAAQDHPVLTASAFNTTVYYQYTCSRNIFHIAIGAVSQVATGGEKVVYWEISAPGQAQQNGVEEVAVLNTMPVQPVGTATAEHGFPPGSIAVKVYRPCSQQSLYVWPASTEQLVEGSTDIIVYFAKALELPLTQP